MYSDPSQKLAVMSIGFLLGSQDDAVVWRGPKKNGIPCTQFLSSQNVQIMELVFNVVHQTPTIEHFRHKVLHQLYNNHTKQLDLVSETFCC